MSCSGPQTYSGKEEVIDGKLANNGITLMHNRSVSENVIYNQEGEPFNGSLEIIDGKLKTSGISIIWSNILACSL